jgi:hypothetical protein
MPDINATSPAQWNPIAARRPLQVPSTQLYPPRGAATQPLVIPANRANFPAGVELHATHRLQTHLVHWTEQFIGPELKPWTQ